MGTIGKTLSLVNFVCFVAEPCKLFTARTWTWFNDHFTGERGLTLDTLGRIFV